MAIRVHEGHNNRLIAELNFGTAGRRDLIWRNAVMADVKVSSNRVNQYLRVNQMVY